LLCTVAALLGAVSGLVLAFMDPSVADDRWSYPQSAGAFAATQSWFVVQHIPLLLGLVAAVPAIGASRVGRWGWFVGCAGMVILTLTEALAILPRDEAADSSLVGTIEAIYGAGTLLIALGLMVGGAAAIRARVWSRFEAWVLFALGAWLIFPTLPMLSLSFMGARLSITGWMLLFAVLGWVLVRRSSSVAVRRPRARLV
jgi:hypothetical protein